MSKTRMVLIDSDVFVVTLLSSFTVLLLPPFSLSLSFSLVGFLWFWFMGWLHRYLLYLFLLFRELVFPFFFVSFFKTEIMMCCGRVC